MCHKTWAYKAKAAVRQQQWWVRSCWCFTVIEVILVSAKLLLYLCIKVFIVENLVIAQKTVPALELLRLRGAQCGRLGAALLTTDQPRQDHYHQTHAYRNKKAARYINSHLFNVCGRVFFLLWSALYLAQFLVLINIILASKTLELNAFFCMNNVSKRDISSSSTFLFHASLNSSSLR